ETATLSGAIMLIIGCATAMSWALTQSGFSSDLAALMAGEPGGGYGVLDISAIAIIILDNILECIPANVMFDPLLCSVARALDINDVHYSIVVIFAMGIGLFAPPFGVGYYGACAISKVDPSEGMRHIWGYVIALLVGLMIVTFVPWISTGFIK